MSKTNGISRLLRITKLLQAGAALCRQLIQDVTLAPAIQPLQWNLEWFAVLWSGDLPPVKCKVTRLPNLKRLPPVEQLRVLLRETQAEAEAYIRQPGEDDEPFWRYDAEGVAGTLPLLADRLKSLQTK